MWERGRLGFVEKGERLGEAKVAARSRPGEDQ